MNENLATVGSNALVLDSPEDTLTREASLIEQQASSVVVTNDAEYAAAGDLTKAVKQMQKKVKDYWEPMRVNAKAAYDEVLAHKKEMLDPLEAAEKILKGKMGAAGRRREPVRCRTRPVRAVRAGVGGGHAEAGRAGNEPKAGRGCPGGGCRRYCRHRVRHGRGRGDGRGVHQRQYPGAGPEGGRSEPE
mgnify:CR=1 FL=1